MALARSPARRAVLGGDSICFETQVYCVKRAAGRDRCIGEKAPHDLDSPQQGVRTGLGRVRDCSVLSEFGPLGYYSGHRGYWLGHTGRPCFHTKRAPRMPPRKVAAHITVKSVFSGNRKLAKGKDARVLQGEWLRPASVLTQRTVPCQSCSTPAKSSSVKPTGNKKA